MRFGVVGLLLVFSRCHLLLGSEKPPSEKIEPIKEESVPKKKEVSSPPTTSPSDTNKPLDQEEAPQGSGFSFSTWALGTTGLSGFFLSLLYKGRKEPTDRRHNTRVDKKTEKSPSPFLKPQLSRSKDDLEVSNDTLLPLTPRTDGKAPTVPYPTLLKEGLHNRFSEGTDPLTKNTSLGGNGKHTNDKEQTYSKETNEDIRSINKQPPLLFPPTAPDYLSSGVSDWDNSPKKNMSENEQPLDLSQQQINLLFAEELSTHFFQKKKETIETLVQKLIKLDDLYREKKKHKKSKRSKTGIGSKLKGFIGTTPDSDLTVKECRERIANLFVEIEENMENVLSKKENKTLILPREKRNKLYLLKKEPFDVYADFVTKRFWKNIKMLKKSTENKSRSLMQMGHSKVPPKISNELIWLLKSPFLKRNSFNAESISFALKEHPQFLDKFYLHGGDPDFRPKKQRDQPTLLGYLLNLPKEEREKQKAYEVIKVILKHKKTPIMDSEWQDRSATLPVIFNIQDGKKLSILKLYLRHGGNPNSKGKAGLTALQQWTQKPQKIDADKIELLLSAPKTNPNVVGANGDTPLHQLIRALFEKDVDQKAVKQAIKLFFRDYYEGPHQYVSPNEFQSRELSIYRIDLEKENKAMKTPYTLLVALSEPNQSTTSSSGLSLLRSSNDKIIKEVREYFESYRRYKELRADALIKKTFSNRQFTDSDIQRAYKEHQNKFSVKKGFFNGGPSLGIKKKPSKEVSEDSLSGEEIELGYHQQGQVLEPV